MKVKFIKVVSVLAGMLFLAVLNGYEIILLKQNENNKSSAGECVKTEIIYKAQENNSDNLEENIKALHSDFFVEMKKVQDICEIQFREIEKLRRTYSELLEIQKREKAAFICDESILLEMEKNAEEQFLMKKFSESYNSYKELLILLPSNNEFRLKKVLSKFNLNPMECFNDNDFKNDLNLLEGTGGYSKEISYIKSLLALERGEEYEIFQN